ncbi:sodium/calcium exchanger 3-like protein [Leptotrombidium deliense]|uniref:Sodium/calcium exchanger 3-like protein n=1 Tax=Leptotrombidium deliense TaxID=299467 RepID=A0A443SP79_9ACAR|nr:sodium/calcium exchanger 3-like protein [Leptotrombidium deliense]
MCNNRENFFKAGKLGPGTIVGSAAFNLLVISAVCVVSIPKNESKRINGISVFVITASFSVFAYFWLFLILTKISPDIVEIWEAFLTLFFFVILVVIAYIADKNFFRRTDAKADTEMDSFNGKIFAARQILVLGAFVSTIGAVQKFFPKGKLTKKNLARFVKEVRRVDPSITEEDAACLAATYLFENEHHSRLFYRVSACRALTGSKTPFPHLNDHLQHVYDHLKSGDGSALQVDGGKEQFITKEAEKAYDEDIAVVQFSAPTAVVLENVGTVEIVLERFGKMDNTFDCIVETLDRTAKSDKDYKPLKERVTFGPNETEKNLQVEIIDDNNWNPDNVFLVKLSLPEVESEDGEARKDVHKGRICMMTVTIIDDDNPGIIAFGQRLITVEENAGKVVIPILREQGADGEVLVKWKTIDGTAKNGVDFQGGEGEVLFEHGVIREEIEIPIVNDYDEFKDEYFEVSLISASNNAKIGKNNHLMVTVTNDDDYNAIMGRLMKKVRKDRKGFHIHRDKWVEQFKAAMVVPGSDSGEGEGEEGVSQPTALDYVLHVFSFGWKILFAFVPPTSIWGGYLTFFVSLVVIGFITCIVGDTAEAFGCLIGLKDEVTAITLVALGTSLPDTFASRTAARMERYADNAIGNITGSNSVNVFLGLGLPWFIAAIVWHVRGEPFEVKAGTLGFNVGLYTGLSLIAIAILMARRSMSFFGKGELGGPPSKSKATAIFLVFLWFVYIIISSLQVYGKIKIK